jgi:acyl-CoA thioesterase
MRFAQDTAVTATDGNNYSAMIHEGWDVVGNANGGYLLAIAARAMAEVSGRPHPMVLNAHYLSPGRPGPVTITTDTLKSGRRFTTVRANMMGPEKPLVTLLGSFGDIDTLEGPMRVDAIPPELPPPEKCQRIEPGPTGFPPAMMGRMELRLHPDDTGYLRGKPSGVPLVRGWFRLLDEEPVDTFALLLAVDAFPPTIFNANLPVSWAPTVELTTHIRGIPRPGWLRCRFSTRFVSGGLLEEDGEIWDDSGRLVAQSRQLALTPKP